MRPIANFALHALAAAVLAGFVTTAAAAAAAPAVSGEVFVKLPPGSRAGDRGGQIEILSYSFGDSSAVKLDRVYVKSWSTSGDAGAAPPSAGGSNQMSMDDTAGKEKSPSSFGEWIADVERPAAGKRNPPTVTLKRGKNSAAGGDPDRPIIAGNVPNASATPLGANETLTVGGGRTETASGRGIDIARVDGEIVSPAAPSGQATGKRQHMPIRARQYYDQPLAKGSVWVRVATPWAGCRVGARYPSLELGGGARRYVLQDVTVASCGGSSAADDRPTEEVAFYYNKINF